MKKKYKVEWCRTYYCHGTITVEAKSQEEAREVAMDRCIEWGEGSLQGGDEDEITGIREICAACGGPVIEDDLLCESCQARDDRHRDLKEDNEGQ